MARIEYPELRGNYINELFESIARLNDAAEKWMVSNIQGYTGIEEEVSATYFLVFRTHSILRSLELSGRAPTYSSN